MTQLQKNAWVTDATGGFKQSIDRKFVVQDALNLANNVPFSITGVELPVDGERTL